MSNQQTEQRQGRMIKMYIPIFKARLAKLENRGHGRSEEAQKLRNTIASAENEAVSLAESTNGKCQCLAKARYQSNRSILTGLPAQSDQMKQVSGMQSCPETEKENSRR